MVPWKSWIGFICTDVFLYRFNPGSYFTWCSVLQAEMKLEEAPFLPFGPSGLATHGRSPTLTCQKHVRPLPTASKNHPETPSWLENGILLATGEGDLSLSFHSVDRNPQPGSGIDAFPALCFPSGAPYTDLSSRGILAHLSNSHFQREFPKQSVPHPGP